MLHLMKEAEAGNPLDVLVIDSLSEFDLMYEETSTEEGFAKWHELLGQMFATVSLVNHAVLKCPIIMTARVAEKRSARPGKIEGLQTSGDPQHFNFDYYPSLRGQFRLALPHYFSLVLYLSLIHISEPTRPY